MAEDVTAFVERVGLTDALEILGEDVWKYTKFSFEQWAEEHNPCMYDQALKAKVLAKMVEIASVTEHWLKIWHLAPADSVEHRLVIEKIKERLNLLTTFEEVQKWQPFDFRLDFQGKNKKLNTLWLQRLAEVAIGFEQWKAVFYEANNLPTKNSDVSDLALANMVGNATNGRRWLEVYHAAQDGSFAQKKALDYFFNQAKTYDDWFDVWYRARNKDENMAKLALAKAVRSAETFSQWHQLFSHHKDNQTLRDLCLEKLVPRAKTFYDWLCVYQASEGQAKLDALEQLLTKPENVGDWLHIWHHTPEDSKAKARALHWLQSFVIRD